MSKAHRGTGIRSMANHGRGKCPVCNTSNIKTLYEHEIDGKKVMVCKFCNANLKNKARAAAKVTAAAAKAEAPAETTQEETPAAAE